ncbi:relaxase/mobilization nuclease domain-containing protein [Pseudolactococcus laudensis]|uniref:relaxase/mobilization nuclease domain-containing protein n=2 Tax=Pseudolactococcus laudensis TaxID=1494461 RepID=UPI002FC7AC51
MATIAKISNGASAASAINYALGHDRPMHEKTEQWLQDNQLERPVELAKCRAVAVGGTNGIDPFIAKEQFDVVRQLHNQTKESNQVLRITQSFALNELNPKIQNDWQKANDLGVELAEKLYPNHQSAVYTHLDGKNHVLHNHIIVNKVNLETGKKLREKKGESVQRARELNDQIAFRENWYILEPPKERQTDTEKELLAKNEYSYMDDLRGRINQSLQDVSVSSYEAFKERLSTYGVILSERGQTFSYAFLDANNKQRRARETRLGSDFGRETILHELENRTRQNEFSAFEQREPAITPLERDTQQRESEIVSLEQAIEPRKSESLKRESKINRFIDTIKQLAGRVPELTQLVTRKLKQTKEKILDDFERRFSKDMKNYKLEQQKSLEKQANRDVQSEKKPTKDHDRGMSL